MSGSVSWGEGTMPVQRPHPQTAAALPGRPASVAPKPPGRIHTGAVVGEGGPCGRPHPTQAETDNPFSTPWSLCPAAGLHSQSLGTPWVGPSPGGPSESLPQAPEALVEGASLSSKAFFVLLLASLHNPFLPSPLQTQVLRALGAPAVSSTEVGKWMPPGKWGGTAENRSLLSHSLPMSLLSQGSISLPAPDGAGRSRAGRSTITGCAPGRQAVGVRSCWSAPPGAAQLAPDTSLASGRGFLGSDDGKITTPSSLSFPWPPPGPLP